MFQHFHKQKTSSNPGVLGKVWKSLLKPITGKITEKGNYYEVIWVQGSIKATGKVYLKND